MRKTLALVVAIAMVGTLAAVAYAQGLARTNTYTVDANIKPKKKGSPKKPKNVRVKFSYSVDEQNNLRPAPVEKYSIRFTGLRHNSKNWPGCTADEINAAQNVSVCSKGSKIGSGSITAVAGSEDNRQDRSINCPLNLEVYNSRKNKAAIYVVGGPNAPAGKTTACPTDTNAAIDANFVRRGKETALEFKVPLVPFRQQLGSGTNKDESGAIEVSVIKVESTIFKKKRKIGKKRRSFFQAAGGCRGGRRAVRVVFDNEDGDTKEASDTVPCKK